MAIKDNFKSVWRYTNEKTIIDNYRDMLICFLEQLITESGLTPGTGGLTMPG